MTVARATLALVLVAALVALAPAAAAADPVGDTGQYSYRVRQTVLQNTSYAIAHLVHAPSSLHQGVQGGLRCSVQSLPLDPVAVADCMFLGVTNGVDGFLHHLVEEVAPTPYYVQDGILYHTGWYGQRSFEWLEDPSWLTRYLP